MKSCLSVIGGIFLVLILIVGGCIAYMALVGGKLDASSKAYADKAVSAIASTWSEDELIARESPQFKKAASREELDQLFKKFRELGPLQSSEEIRGDAKVNFTTTDGKVVTAVYVEKATFQNGKAEITITLIQNDGLWQILGFRVNSPLFLN